MTASLYALPYLGGKAASQRSGGLCRWIVSLMGSCRSCIETHGGMYGVGLARPPSANETLNDLDCRVVNWWRQLRDHGDELIRRVALTPDSRAEYERALDLLDDDDPMLAARATSVVLMQSLSGATGSGCGPAAATATEVRYKAVHARNAAAAVAGDPRTGWVTKDLRRQRGTWGGRWSTFH